MISGQTYRSLGGHVDEIPWDVIPYYRDVKRASRRLKSPAYRLFIQQFVLANKEWNIKAPYYLQFVRGSQQSPVDSNV